jgi:hypothetical protein|tara:strand:- start:199 stop:570 length:372 start_codon:yes stop_codon:yes gene_type:complete
MNKSNQKTATSKVVSANPFKPTGKSGGGVAQTMTLTLTENAQQDMVVAPRQVQLVLAYLHEQGGSATVKQIDDFSVTADGDIAWCNASGDAYEQTPSKILRTYISKMRGADDWGKHGVKVLVS